MWWLMKAGASVVVGTWLLLISQHSLAIGEVIASEKSDVNRVDLWIEKRQVKGDLSNTSAKAVTLKKVTVRQGDWVELLWHADETVSLHLHGYDIEQVVKAGETAMMRFHAHATGRFQITAHGFGDHTPGEDHGSGHHTALLYFEVYPQ